VVLVVGGSASVPDPQPAGKTAAPPVPDARFLLCCDTGNHAYRHMDETETETEALQARLKELEGEHRALDRTIAEMAATAGFDQLQLQRLKRRKLHLKDEIQRIEDQLFPDIIA